MDITMILVIMLYIITSGYAPRGLQRHLKRGRVDFNNPIFYFRFLKKCKFFLCDCIGRGSRLSPIFNFSLNFQAGEIFSMGFFLGRVVVPSPKLVINHPRTHEKLPCKGEPYQFSVQTKRQTNIRPQPLEALP